MTETNRTPRSCRCGTMLALDNPSPLCSSCQRGHRDLRAGPPALPATFWDSPHMHEAVQTWHMGKVVTAFRNHPYHGTPLTQAIVAGWVGLTQAQLSRIETGAQPQDLSKLIHWARILKIPPPMLWFKLPPDQEERDTSRKSQFLVPMHDGHLRTSSSVPHPASPAHRPRTPGSHAAAMQSFRAADRNIGGGHLYATVLQYLHSEVGPDLFAGPDDGPRTFTAGAALTEMAGWMAHDAGHDTLAWGHFTRAHQLAALGGDPHLSAHILASLSHLAHHLGNPHDGIRLAQHGRELLKKAAQQPVLQARLMAMQARGLAALQQPRHSALLLLDAERMLTKPATEELSPWVSGFDEASLASETARCLQHAGDIAQARLQAERIITLRPADRTRSRAFGQLLLASTLIAHNELGQAALLVQEILDTTRHLTSYLVLRQLLDIRDTLAKHRPASSEVTLFLPGFEKTLRDRLSLYTQLNEDPHERTP